MNRKDRKIEIKGEIIFYKETFYSLLKGYLNLTYYRSGKNVDKSHEEIIEEEFKINDIDSFVNFIVEKLDEYRNGKENYKLKNSIADLFFDLQERTKYLYVEPVVTYDKKPLDKLSVGQRGTVYLCIKLATNAFSTPIIFDQPEDDLDNKFIIEELVDIFKNIKKYRQVIIVTHNANLVVNSDAEQVIVAENNDEKLSYVAGSLENKGIIDSVCKILEGGKLAFERRKNRYNL